MNPSKDHILKCVEEATEEILNSHKTRDGYDTISSVAQQFLKVSTHPLTLSWFILIYLFILKLFSTNLATATAEVELNQNKGITICFK